MLIDDVIVFKSVLCGLDKCIHTSLPILAKEVEKVGISIMDYTGQCLILS